MTRTEEIDRLLLIRSEKLNLALQLEEKARTQENQAAIDRKMAERFREDAKVLWDVSYPLKDE